MIRELKTLLVVAKEGTFAAAGNKIGLTQAAVSAQMQRLEQELGLKLFDKVGRSAELNSTGRQILDQAKDIIDRYNSLGTSTETTVNALTLKIGAISSAQRHALPHILQQYFQSQPNVRIKILPGVSINLVDQVDSSELSLAVTIMPPFPLHADLIWRPLVSEPYVCVTPKDWDCLDWREALITKPFIRYDRTSFGGRQVDRFLQRAAVDVDEKCEADELEALIGLVAAGAGVALIPKAFDFSPWQSSITELPLGKQTFFREVGLVYPRSQQHNTAIAELIQTIEDYYQDLD
ncbi:LysR family transcriptional regulator [Marinomonas communis]|uniref:LysR family transcriptional regulator n=1 Tax=Marinomonas communis TaxID=28254 RepID=A0A4R6X772_9GAMM|nr:LysR family transcriptional regulator [Marinomonas communis]TDR14876.1 LysR family transcriptional regulator [Marinomonas communis]